VGNLKIILEIKEKSNHSLLFLSDGFRNAKKEKKEALKKENISLELLPAIDRLLKKNGLSLDKISRFEIISDVPKNWTSMRIAEITFKSLALAR
jgi:tRNA A37 threonylcarbamoyladenosine modification protein TsaB